MSPYLYLCISLLLWTAIKFLLSIFFSPVPLFFYAPSHWSSSSLRCSGRDPLNNAKDVTVTLWLACCTRHVHCVLKQGTLLSLWLALSYCFMLQKPRYVLAPCEPPDSNAEFSYTPFTPLYRGHLDRTKKKLSRTYVFLASP